MACTFSRQGNYSACRDYKQKVLKTLSYCTSLICAIASICISCSVLPVLSLAIISWRPPRGGNVAFLLFQQGQILMPGPRPRFGYATGWCIDNIPLQGFATMTSRPLSQYIFTGLSALERFVAPYLGNSVLEIKFNRMISDCSFAPCVLRM